MESENSNSGGVIKHLCDVCDGKMKGCERLFRELEEAFKGAWNNLNELGSQLADLRESHHSCPAQVESEESKGDEDEESKGDEDEGTKVMDDKGEKSIVKENMDDKGEKSIVKENNEEFTESTCVKSKIDNDENDDEQTVTDIKVESMSTVFASSDVRFKDEEEEEEDRGTKYKNSMLESIRKEALKYNSELQEKSIKNIKEVFFETNKDGHLVKIICKLPRQFTGVKPSIDDNVKLESNEWRAVGKVIKSTGFKDVTVEIALRANPELVIPTAKTYNLIYVSNEYNYNKMRVNFLPSFFLFFYF